MTSKADTLLQAVPFTSLKIFTKGVVGEGIVWINPEFKPKSKLFRYLVWIMNWTSNFENPNFCTLYSTLHKSNVLITN